MEKVIYFLTIGDKGYSRSWTYYTGLKKIGVKTEFIKFDNKKLFRTFIALRNKSSRTDVFIVMSPSHYLTPFTRLFLGRNTFLDAGWSLFEGSVLTRMEVGFMGINVVKTFFIDLIAFKSAKKIFLESESQKIFLCKLFLLKKSKCFVIYTGVDENQFIIDHNFQTPPDLYSNGAIVLFRGKYTVEAGLEVLADASMILSQDRITIWIFSPGIPKSLAFSKSTYINDGFVDSKQGLAKIYSKSSLTLGQLSKHPRLHRTIPHKAFESAFHAKPYLSSRTKGILEIFSENEEIICFEPGDAIDLAHKIRLFFAEKSKFEKLGNKMESRYKLDLSQDKLASKMLGLVEILCK